MTLTTTSDVQTTDVQTTDFEETCYKYLRQVPKGKVTTYQALAKAVGTSAYRAVGNAMGKNPYAPKVPCHRVVRNNGALGGFAHGPVKKARMLKSEGVLIKDGKVVEFEQHFFDSFNTY